MSGRTVRPDTPPLRPEGPAMLNGLAGISRLDVSRLDLSKLVLRHVPHDGATRELTVDQALDRLPHGIAVLVTHHPSFEDVAHVKVGDLARAG